MDTKNLAENLKKLTGHDFERAESEERARNNLTAEISLSKSFQARLASYALDTNPDEIKDLPLGEYVKITATVSNFLLENLAEDVQLKRSESSPQISMTEQDQA